MTAIPIAVTLLAGSLLLQPGTARRLVPRTGSARGRATALTLTALTLGTVAVVVVPPPLVASAIAGIAMMMRRRHRAVSGRRRRDEAQAIAAALETVVGELRVGGHPLRAFAVAAADCGGEVGAALETVVARVGLGGDVVSALRAVATRSAVPSSWNRIAICWSLAAEHGLGMAALMRAAQRDIIERSRFSDRMAAGLAGAKATAGILAALPLIGVVLGQLIGADPIHFLFDGGTGGWFLLAGIGLICAGIVWSDLIVDRLML